MPNLLVPPLAKFSGEIRTTKIQLRVKGDEFILFTLQERDKSINEL